MLSEQQLMNVIQYYYENRDGAMLSQGEGGIRFLVTMYR